MPTQHIGDGDGYQDSLFNNISPSLIMAKLKPGMAAKASGQYEIINRVGNRTGVERTVTKGEPLPPTPKSGQGYRFADKTKH
jgi:hypothetical protein